MILLPAEVKSMLKNRFKRTIRSVRRQRDFGFFDVIRLSIRLAVRNASKHPLFTILNIGGLALGIAATFVLSLYVQQELTYDRHFEDHDRIYRITTDFFNMGGFAKSQNQLLDHLPDALPELELATRFDKGFQSTTVVTAGRTYDESRYFFVDSTFFRMFSYRFLAGRRDNVMRGPDAVVISDETALKYFGSTAEAMGRTLLVGKEKRAYRIEGVVETPPRRSHLIADLWLPLEARERQTYWTNIEYYNYVKLRPGAGLEDLERSLEHLLRRHAHPAAQSGETYGAWRASSRAVTFDVQPLADIYLHSDHQFEIAPGGNPTQVYILGVIGIFIILVAGANYVNLTTAHSSIRAREIGVKKTLGARRGSLIQQFLSEAVVAAVLATVIAAGVAVIMLDVFEYVTGNVLVESLFTSMWPMAALAGLAVGVGLLAGLYPAFYLSSFPPVRILKGEWTATGGSGLRSGLVVMQFAIATGLGIGSLVIYQQLSYMQSADKGFEHEGVVVIENVDVLGDHAETFRQEVERHEVVSGSSFAGRTPTGTGVAAYNFRTPMMEESISIQTFRGDEDFLPTLGMRLLAGRNFSGDLASDSSAVILNESAVRVLGLGNEPIGREVNEGQHVIGVVRDFHFQSLRETIEPVAVTYLTGGRQLLLKVGRRDAADFVASLAELWRRFSPDEEMRYGFLDENFERLAEEERMLSRAVTFFTLLAVLIACAGLFGLTAFAVQRRTKEIGIRKVFGATAAAVVVLLSKDVARLVLIAFVAAAPVAFLALDDWLADFAYRIDLCAVPFVLAGGGALVLALLTVGYHAIRAASIQPVESLRYE